MRFHIARRYSKCAIENQSPAVLTGRKPCVQMHPIHVSALPSLLCDESFSDASSVELCTLYTAEVAASHSGTPGPTRTSTGTPPGARRTLINSLMIERLSKRARHLGSMLWVAASAACLLPLSMRFARLEVIFDSCVVGCLSSYPASAATAASRSLLGSTRSGRWYGRCWFRSASVLGEVLCFMQHCGHFLTVN